MVHLVVRILNVMHPKENISSSIYMKISSSIDSTLYESKGRSPRKRHRK
jgi:hypothetical protein